MKDKYKYKKRFCDDEDIINICEEPEKKHKKIANLVYKDEIEKIKNLSIREKELDIFKNYIQSKYQAVCQMMEAMYNYVYYYNNKNCKDWIFKKYMKHENPADWVDKSSRPIDHYKIIFNKVYYDYNK